MSHQVNFLNYMTEHTVRGTRGSPEHRARICLLAYTVAGDPSSSRSHGQLLGKARNGSLNILKHRPPWVSEGCLGLPTPSAPQAQAANQQLVRGLEPQGA